MTEQQTAEVSEAPNEGSAPEVETLVDEVSVTEQFSDAIDKAIDGLDKSVSGEPDASIDPGDIVEEGNNEPQDADDSLPGDDLDTDVSDWTPKAANRFKQLKEERKQYKSEIEELRQKTTEYETKIRELSGTESLDDVRAKLDEYEQERMFYNLEQSRVYQETVDTPLKETVSLIKSIANMYNLDSDEILDVVAEENIEGEAPETNPDGTPYLSKDDRLEDLLADAPLRVQAELLNHFKTVDNIFERQAELYSNVSEALKEAELVEEERLNYEAAQRARERSVVTDNVVDRIVEKLPFVKSIEGLDIDSVKTDVADRDFSTAHVVDQQYAAAVSKIFPAVVKEYLALQKESESLIERLSEYEDAEPGSGYRGQDSGSAPTQPNDGGFLDRVNAALASV